MRFFLPLADAPQGGMYSFFRHLRAYLPTSGHSYTDRMEDDWDVLIAASWAVPYATVLRAKRSNPRGRVLHRIDGAGRDYGRDAASDRRAALVNSLADVTVFQSRYGKFATTRKFRFIEQDGPVIYNPVDVERFTPEGERLDLPGRVRVANVAWSTNPRKGARDLFEIARSHPAVDFILVGRYDDPPALPNLHVLGYADWDRLPRALRSCHLFLTLSRNEACPNVVLEALASGLPVLHHASGGTPELVGECGEAVEVGTFGAALERVLRRHAELAAAARRRAVEHFAPSVIFPAYLEAARRAERRPVPGIVRRTTTRVACRLK